MFANLLRIHHNYILDYIKVICVDIMFKTISRKYINNKYIQMIYTILLQYKMNI